MDNEKECLKKLVINGQPADYFNCAICHEVYENPRYLQCNHSFCLKCILSYIRRKLRENILETNFLCPLCRRGLNISTKRLRNVIQIQEVEEEDVKHLFPRNIALANAIENLNIEQEYCEKHPNKIYDHFCEDHGHLCCSKCILRSRRNCRRVIDIDECDEQTLGEWLRVPRLMWLTSYKTCEQKIVSLQSTKQKAVNSLERLKSDVIDAITEAQGKVEEVTSKEIEYVSQQYGPRPEPVSRGFTCNRRSFILEMQYISSRQTECNKTNINDNLGAKLAVPLQDVRTSIKRKVDAAGLDNCTATIVRGVLTKGIKITK